jgi:hypothetical protein
MTNTELKVKGFECLAAQLGLVDMETFIMLIQQDRFDYARWRKDLFNNMTGEEISRLAMMKRGI